MTAGAEKIEKLISYNISDWAVTDAEEITLLGVLRTDLTPTKTLMDLVTADLVAPLLARVTANRRQLIELLGGRITTTAAALIQRQISRLGEDYEHVFTISNELQNNLARLGSGLKPLVCHTPAVRVNVAGSTNRPFTGSGATGTDVTRLSVPLVDQALLLGHHVATKTLYTNPIPGSLPGYLATLSANERREQAITLLNQQIVTFVPSSYAAGIPDRSDVVGWAAKVYDLDGATLAAFILAEQRDQSRNEDAKDYVAATSAVEADTSIGLGQVKISTVTRHDLFADLLSTSARKKLTHKQIARLLASDEFNIFAVAKYIRIVADSGATKSIAKLTKTKAKFPNINLAAFSKNSSAWPTDNIKALGSEYTSKPWDDRLSLGWGDFVFEARRDIQASGVFR